ncbi:MAG: ATP-binding protein [Acidobacteria bacterium]|nr:ATP-binding protein [Acidobacteriota bacterium]
MSARSSLVSRFAASTAILAALTVLLATVFFAVIHRDFFGGQIDATLKGFSDSMAERVWDDPELAQRVARSHGIGIVVVTPESRFAYGPDGEPVDPDEQLAAGWRYRRIDTRGPEGWQVSFLWDIVLFGRAHIPLLVGLIVSLLLLIGVTYVFQLGQLRPLRWLRTGVDAVSRGDFSSRVPVVREDEIGQVARAFNHMIGRVKQMLSDREVLLADVSHELRSPLARIKVALELLPESEKREAIARDVREMEALTGALLERERVRTKTAHLEADLVDLAALVREVACGFEGRSPGVELTLPDSGALLRADRALMRVLIQNLIDNAIKFSLPDSHSVEVSVRTARDEVTLDITDDGCGIPEADAERVFEPFVKLDPARGHRAGYGLGLDLCRRIAEAHGGAIEIGRPAQRGTRVSVTLPSA